MPIQRIESLTYGVADIGLCTRFWEDVGLEKLEAGTAGATFRLPGNQFVHLRHMDDASLPPAPNPGPTMREVIWGLDSTASLEALGASLSRDRDVKRGVDGTLHLRDETGFALGLAVARPIEIQGGHRQYNGPGSTSRLNRRVSRLESLAPMRLGHIVYEVTAREREKAADFYLERLGFKLTDRIVPLGDFMRVAGVADHHSLFLMCIRQQAVGFDHAALELPGFDEVMFSGDHLPARGWKKTWGPGRQPFGCHVFWHFENPCGGELDLFADMDRFDDSWEPKVWQTLDARNIWGAPPPK